MHLPISPRLLTCCGFITPNDRVADIGCDHGYLGIYLLINGKAKSVIAADVNEQPLQSARDNAVKYGVADRMSFYLSNGVVAIPRAFDTMVCAGMGADTMISILTAAPWLKSEQYRLILQCQSKTPMLRRFLSENGWHITEETVLRDGRFLYTVMEVIYRPGTLLSPGECYFPPALLENPAEALPEYYKRVVDGLALSVNNQGAAADPFKAAALKELQAMAEVSELRWLKEVNHDHS